MPDVYIINQVCANTTSILLKIPEFIFKYIEFDNEIECNYQLRCARKSYSSSMLQTFANNRPLIGWCSIEMFVLIFLRLNCHRLHEFVGAQYGKYNKIILNEGKTHRTFENIQLMDFNNEHHFYNIFANEMHFRR